MYRSLRITTSVPVSTSSTELDDGTTLQLVVIAINSLSRSTTTKCNQSPDHLFLTVSWISRWEHIFSTSPHKETSLQTHHFFPSNHFNSFTWRLQCASYHSCIFFSLGSLHSNFANSTRWQAPWPSNLYKFFIQGRPFIFRFSLWAKPQNRTNICRVQLFDDGVE